MTGQQVHVGVFWGGGGWEGRKHTKYLWYGSQNKSAWVIGLQLFLIALSGIRNITRHSSVDKYYCI